MRQKILRGIIAVLWGVAIFTLANGSTTLTTQSPFGVGTRRAARAAFSATGDGPGGSPHHGRVAYVHDIDH